MNTFKFFSMAALTLVMTACSSDDSVLEQELAQQGVMHFTATIAAPNGGATTRSVYTEGENKIDVAWKVGDQISVIYNGVKDVVEVTEVDKVTGLATIDGTITSHPEDGDAIAMYYPANFVSRMDGFLPVFDYSKWQSQDGTLAYIQDNLDLRHGVGIVTVKGNNVTLKENASFISDIAIWKFSLQDDAATPNALAASAVKVNVGDNIVASATSASPKNEYYLSIIPIRMGTGDLTIEATVGSSTYTYTKAGSVQLLDGKYYQSTVNMHAGR